MQFTQAGLPLSFEATFDSPSLSVAMKVFDDSGGFPILITTLPMAAFLANSYRAKYTPIAGKTYLVHKAVYTDGTFATLDSNYAASTESFRAEDLAGILLNALVTNYDNAGSVGEALGLASESAPIPANIEAFIDLLPMIEEIV